MSLSSEERELFIHVGLTQNDLLLYQRIWAALMYRNPKTQLAREAHAAQSVALLLALVGKLFEACEQFDKRFLSQRIGHEFQKKFSSSQLAAVEYLKKLRGTGNLLAKIRNDFAFHYHSAELSKYIIDMPEQRQFSLYLGSPDGNTMNVFAAEPLLISLMKVTKKRKPITALSHIHTVAGDALTRYYRFVAGVQLVILKKMLGDRPLMEDCEIGDDEYLPHDQFVIPFFMTVPVGHRRPRGALKKR